MGLFKYIVDANEYTNFFARLNLSSPILSNLKDNRYILNQDSQLVKQFKIPSHKNAAFTQLVKQYQEKLYWHIRRMVVEHEDANDVLQNSFIKVWNALDNFREDSQLYTWLYRIATNESLSFFGTKKEKTNQFI